MESITWDFGQLFFRLFRICLYYCKSCPAVIDLTGHPKAKRCYGWTYGETEQIITILELPPVTDAHSAVKVGVAYQIKKEREK